MLGVLAKTREYYGQALVILRRAIVQVTYLVLYEARDIRVQTPDSFQGEPQKS